MNRLRVVFLAYYPAPLLKEHLALQDSNVQHPATWIVNLVHALGERSDIDLHVVAESINVAYSQDVTVENVGYHFVKSPGTLNLSTLYYLNVKRLVKKVRALQPAVVHAHGCEGSIGLAGVQSGYPCLVSVQGLLTEIVRTDKNWFGRASLRMQLLAFNERRVLKQAKYVGTRTDFASEYVKRANPKTQVFYAPEVIARAFFEVDAPLVEPNLVYVGSIIPRKDIGTLIQALAIVRQQVSKCRLFIIGSGPDDYVHDLSNEAAQLGVEESVEFLGFLTSASIATLFKKCSVFVLPSLIENSPNSLAEAMCAGLPVVATNVGGIPSIVDDNVTGILSPPRDVDALSNAIIRLLGDKPLRQKMGAAAREKGRRAYAPDVVANQTMEAYKRILDLEQQRRHA